MEFANVFDEQRRFMRLDVTASKKSGQLDSHTYSYLWIRNMLKACGGLMGLEQDNLVVYRRTSLPADDEDLRLGHYDVF